VVVVKNGTEKMRFPGKTMPDGSIRVLASGKWMPVTNSDACKAMGIEPKTVAAKASPVEALAHMGDNGYGLHVYAATEWDSIQNQKRADAATALESAVPGLAEAIRLSDAAYNERERYSRAFDRMMADEYNDGARPPKPEDKTIGEKLRRTSRPIRAPPSTSKHGTSMIARTGPTTPARARLDKRQWTFWRPVAAWTMRA